MTLEAAESLHSGPSLGLLALEEASRLGTDTSLGDGHAMQGAVELAIAAAVEAVAIGSARGDWDRRDPGHARELGVGPEALKAGRLGDELGGRQGAAAGQLEQPWGLRPHEQREL